MGNIRALVKRDVIFHTKPDQAELCLRLARLLVGRRKIFKSIRSNAGRHPALWKVKLMRWFPSRVCGSSLTGI